MLTRTKTMDGIRAAIDANTQAIADVNTKLTQLLSHLTKTLIPEPRTFSIPPPRCELTVFDGSNPPPLDWIFQAERFFSYHSTPDEKRIDLASFYMSGQALTWFQWMHRNQQLSSWPALTQALQRRFGPSSFAAYHLQGIGETRSMTRKENQDASSMKRLKTCDNDGQSPWSDLNHDVLFLVMMQLGVFDFPAFSGVCKSWRSFAISNKSKLMASRSTMYISISANSSEEDSYYYLEDNEGRSFNSILPHSGCRTCVGFTCGHLVLFGNKTHDFWLLDPVTRHGVHFPNIPSQVSYDAARFRSSLVFSPAKSGWVFVMTDRSHNIWFSVAGQGAWNHVSSTFPIVDLHAYKEKIYTINNAGHLCLLSLNPEPKLTLLETKNTPDFPTHRQFVSCNGSLNVVRYLGEGYYEFHKLDFDEMKWVLLGDRIRKTGASSHTKLKHSAVTHEKSKLYTWKHMVCPKIV